MFFDHYPYTNFHNVNLDWVLQAVKAWGQTVEANDRAFRDLKEANEDFKEYVRNYLQDLDITDEINTKLDNMLASGILTPYFAPYVKGYVDSWLASHVTPTSPALDSTLTLSGAAARADSTGKRLKDLAYIDALSTPEIIAALNRSQVLPGYRVQGIAYDYNGHYYVCGGSVDETGTGVIVKMTKPDFTDAEITEIPQLGHANDITYYDGYLYVCTVGGGDAPQWGIYKINVNDFTDKTLISNAPENTIGISYRQGDFWLLAPYRIYRTTDFTSYEVVVANTNDLLTAYGIPTSGRISQTIFRAAGYLIGWVCSFVFEDRHYGALTFFNSAGEPIAFKMFPAYHTEIQGAVYADMSIYLVADGKMVNVFRMDPRHLSYVQLKAGDDLNSFTGRGTLYSTGSNVSAELLNSPSSGEGFTVQVDRLGVYNTIQTARTNSGRELYRVKSFSAGTWGEWIEPAAEVAQIKDDLSAYNAEVGQIKEDLSVGLSALALGNRLLIKKLVFSDGYWNTSGVLTPSITTFHTEKMELIQGHQYYVKFPTTTTKIIMRNFNSDGTVAGSSERTTSGIFIPTTNTIAFNGLGDPKADDIYLFDNETSLLTSDEFATSTNALDPHFIEINRGRYMRPDGTMGSSDLYAYSGKINVSEGDVIYSVINGENTGSFRFVTAYDMDDHINAEVGVSTTVNSYTVPANISAVRVTILLSEYDGKEYAVNINKVYPYEPYFSDKKVPFENRVFFNAISNNADDVKKANTDIESLTSSITEKPLSTMPDYVVNTLAYKPMAKPSKGYICLVSDDGKLGLATYAIPMVINKAVPLTLAVMSSSEVFRQGDSIKNVILDAVNNHGCEISQHGGINWTEYTEQTLNEYFDDEKAFFDGLGLSVKSAVIPSHYTTPLIQTIAGGRYGVVRSGYRGHNAQGTGVTIYDYYDYYTSGEFSNLYGLSSFNIKDSLAGNKSAIDYAYDNNKVVIMYWHESGLTDADKVTLETTIDYAKDKGLEFITLSVLKHLIDHERTI